MVRFVKISAWVRPWPPISKFWKRCKSPVHSLLCRRKKEGLDHIILEGGVGFSGGQRQALLLTRLLIRQPKILLLDEPTAAIDDVSEKQLIDHLKSYLSHRTMVVATHRRAVLELVDRIIVVNDGKIVMDGPRDQILNQSQGGNKRVVGASA